MLGYIDKTLDETFDEEGYFCTGDGGYVDEDGYLFWEGRLTDMIKTGGANVSPVEVDAVLALMPGVKRAQTVGVPHETLTEIVVACIVPHEGARARRSQGPGLSEGTACQFQSAARHPVFREEEFAVTGSEKVKTGMLRELAGQRLAGGGRIV